MSDMQSIVDGAPALREALAAIELAPGVSLREIKSFAVLADIVPLFDSNNMGSLLRIGGAAIGFSWVGPGKPKVKYEGHDPLVYGGAVLDELVQRGLALDVLTQAGTLLVMLGAIEFARVANVRQKSAEKAAFLDQKQAQ